MTWGECPTTTCTGVRQRTRECVNPPPVNGGADCTGISVENGPCDPIVGLIRNTLGFNKFLDLGYFLFLKLEFN